MSKTRIVGIFLKNMSLRQFAKIFLTKCLMEAITDEQGGISKKYSDSRAKAYSLRYYIPIKFRKTYTLLEKCMSEPKVKPRL